MLRIRVHVDEDTHRRMGSRFYCMYMIHIRYKNPQLSAEGFQHNSSQMDNTAPGRHFKYQYPIDKLPQTEPAWPASHARINGAKMT